MVTVTLNQKRHLFGWRFIGAGDEVRTRDLDLGKVALYQLSYSRLRFIRRDG